ncbi:MAG: alpha-N-arabinofuranosidase [Armatimonadota bacterium]
MTQTAITVYPTRTGATVHPNIYGHFAEHLGRCIYGGIWVGAESSIPHDGGIRLDTVMALRRLALPVLRWPGGCFADNYHWRDGIGPREERPTRLNMWWLQGESNAFGTHEFMRFCRIIGTEPYLCANVGSGTVEEARSWMEYCNARQDTALTRERAANGDGAPFNVKYWGVGNESWGCGGSMTPEHYADLYRQYATYMRQFGGEVTLIACGSHQGIPDWDERFLCGLKGMENLIDAVALHNYSGWGMPGIEYTDEQYYHLLTAMECMDSHLTRAVQVCRAHSNDRHQIKVIMDEWGTWFREATTERSLLQDSTMMDAVFTGLAFHTFHRHAADLIMTNMAQTVNVLQALMLTEGPKLCLTPTYWVYDLYKPHRDGKTVTTELRGSTHTLTDGKHVPLCSASATVKGNTLAISLVNADLDAPCDVLITLPDTPGATVVSARVLTSPNVRDHNTPDQPDIITPRNLPVTPTPQGLTTTLPPHAVAMIEVSVGNGNDGLADGQE